MEKLNELVEMGKASDGKWFATAINPESILAIAEAFRELEQRALAAENAKIKASVEMHAAGFKICPVCKNQDECETDDVVWMVREATPATDAYLNSVRAEGVEMAISNAFGDGIPVNRMQFIKRMSEFAANLRKENGND